MIELTVKPTTLWSESKLAFLIENYPKYGKAYCMEKLEMTEQQIRYKASKLKLIARGVSEAWMEKTKQHGEKLRGRKRPEHSEWMKDNIRKNGPAKISDEGRAAISRKTSERIKQNGHPRGALGMKHSQATKDEISRMMKRRSAMMTQEQKIKMIRKQMETREKNGTMIRPRVGESWKSGWREIGGIRKYYRSRWEANYARYLEWLKSNGNILSWEHESKTFWFDGVKRGSVSYLPDFRVIEISGKEVFHEVKGWMDARSKTKIKRMAKYHPSVELIVIDSKSYNSIASMFSRIIEGWE